MIKPIITIAGTYWSRFCTEFTADGSINTRSEPTKAKIVLANINRKFDDMFTPQKDSFTIQAQGIDENGKEYVWPIAKGIISDVVCDQDWCTINGTCLIGDLADALPIHWSSNHQKVKISEILTSVMALHDPIVEVDYQAHDPDLEQKQFDACTTFQEVINYCVSQVNGAIVFTDETGHLHIWDSTKRRPTINLDHHVVGQNTSKSVMGYINVVTVHGDLSEAETGEPGSENSSMPQIQGEAKDTTSIAKYGELIGPDIYLPNIKSEPEAQKQADELLEFLKLNRDGLTSPTVVGMAPYLTSLVTYHCKNGPEGDEVFVEGVVTRKKVSFSGESGFTTNLEIAPHMLAVSTPEALAIQLEALEEAASSNLETVTES